MPLGRDRAGRVTSARPERSGREPRTQDPRGGRVRRPGPGARDLVRERRDRAGPHGPGPVRRHPDRHPARRPVGADRGRARSGWPSPAASCRRSRRWPSPAGRCCHGPRRPPGGGRADHRGAGRHPRGSWATVDVVLPMLHGPFGEDGTMQGLLEMAGVRYVGAGVLASAVSMDKEYMKLIFKAKGLPVGPFVVVRDRDWRGRGQRTAAAAAAAGAPRRRNASGCWTRSRELGWPVFVKPARGGSSIGTSRGGRPGRAARGDRDRTALRPQDAGREGHPRPGDRVRRAGRAWTARPRTPACPGSSWWTAARSSSTSRRSTWTTSNQMVDPGPDSRRAPGGGAAPGRGRVRGGIRRGTGPGGLLLHAGRRRSCSTRSTRCPG